MAQVFQEAADKVISLYGEDFPETAITGRGE